MFYCIGCRKTWTSRLALCITALFAFVQIVAAGHHAHGPEELIGEGIYSSFSAQKAATSSVASRSANPPALRRAIASQANPDLCVACQLAAVGKARLAPNPSVGIAPRLLAWYAQRFVRSYRATGFTPVSLSNRGPPASALSVTA